MWDIKVVLARQYSNNLSEEVTKGLDEKTEQGWYAGTKKRGYLSVRPDGSKRAIWIKDGSENSVLCYIKKAFETYANTDYSLKQVTKMMFKEGWRTEDGKPISKNCLNPEIVLFSKFIQKNIDCSISDFLYVLP